MPGLSGPRSGHFDGRIAQLVEQLTLNQRVQGSSPCAPTIEINDLALIQSDRTGPVCSEVCNFVRLSSFSIALIAIAGSRLR